MIMMLTTTIHTKGVCRRGAKESKDAHGKHAPTTKVEITQDRSRYNNNNKVTTICDSILREQEMACLGLFVPGLLLLHQYKNPVNINKFLVRTTSSSSPELFASIVGKYERNTIKHTAPTKQTCNNQKLTTQPRANILRT